MIASPLQPDLQVCVLSEYDADGFLGIGIDGDASKVALQPAEAYHPLGFISRPLDPESTDGDAKQGGACTVLRLSEGNEDHVVVLSDPRCTPALPRLPKGSAMVYGPSGSDDPPRILLSGTDETMTIHVPSTAKVTIEVEGGPQIIIDNSFVQLGGPGGKFVMVDDGSLIVSLQAAFTAAGTSWSPPAGYLATKVKAT